MDLYTRLSRHVALGLLLKAGALGILLWDEKIKANLICAVWHLNHNVFTKWYGSHYCQHGKQTGVFKIMLSSCLALGDLNVLQQVSIPKLSNRFTSSSEKYVKGCLSLSLSFSHLFSWSLELKLSSPTPFVFCMWSTGVRDHDGLVRHIAAAKGSSQG